MGFFDLFGGGSDTGARAAELQNQATQKAIKQLRKNFGITEQNLTPFISSGVSGLNQFQNSSTPQGLDETLRALMNTDSFGALAEERGRAVEGQLAAGGLSRAGTALQEAARVPTDLALQIESLLSGRSNNLAGLGLNAALNLENLRGGNNQNIANLTQGVGEAQASGLIADQQADAAQGQQTMDTLLSAAGIAAMFFSDPSLKENVEEIGEVRGLKIYQWDWIQKAKGTLIEKCCNIGFMADEVKEVFPEYVSTFCGFDVIDYRRLLNRLEAS